MNKTLKRPPTCLTIAGSDCGGGAGIQADLKTFAVHRVYGMSAITALTSQNTKEIRSIKTLPTSFIKDQLDVIFEDFEVDVVKIGMLSSVGVIKTVAKVLNVFKPKIIVLDPVMISKSNVKLLNDNAIISLQKLLLPLTTLVTPNIPEAELISGKIVKSEKDFLTVAKIIQKQRANNVLIKGGHFKEKGKETLDLLLLEDGSHHIFKRKRVHTNKTHGTGCTFSSAIAANLALGYDTKNSVENARNYLQDKIEIAQNFSLGLGHGPLFH